MSHANKEPLPQSITPSSSSDSSETDFSLSSPPPPVQPPNHFGTYIFSLLCSYGFYSVLKSHSVATSVNLSAVLLEPHVFASFPDSFPSLPVWFCLLVVLLSSLAGIVINELSENHETARFRPSLELLRQETESALIDSSESESSDDDEAHVVKEKKSSVGGGQLIWREEEGKSVLVQKFFPPPANSRRKIRTDYTMSEVAKHNKKSDCWIVIESRVYDVTKFIDLHPGGWLPMVNMGGKDCTDAFANYHPASVYRKTLPSFYIGDVVDTLDNDPFTVEHREIRQELLRRGLFETNNMYYALKILWLSSLLLLSIFFSVVETSYSSHMIGAFLLATFWQQLAFVGHDIGHNSMSHKKLKETRLGILFGNTFGGISLGWWKRSHNVHHIVCNSVQHDPDIQHPPVFAVSDECFDVKKLAEGATKGDAVVNDTGYYSTYHEKWMTMDGIWKFFICYQHWLFYPIMAVARFNLYVQGIVFIVNCKKQDGWHAKHFQTLEAASIATFLGLLTWIIWQLPAEERVTYALASHALAGMLHVQICISHFTMDTYHGHAYNDASDEWFRMQLFTTMNVDSWRWMDFFHGGLQFQIEHHLYPRLPRHNLREARALVKPLCDKWGIHYHEPGFIQANIELISSMKATAFKCRNYGLKAVGGFKETSLYEGLMAEG